MLELFWLIRLIKLLNDYLEARTDVIRLILIHTKTVHFHVREGAINMGDGGYPAIPKSLSPPLWWYSPHDKKLAPRLLSISLLFVNYYISLIDILHTYNLKW